MGRLMLILENSKPWLKVIHHMEEVWFLIISFSGRMNQEVMILKLKSGH